MCMPGVCMPCALRMLRTRESRAFARALGVCAPDTNYYSYFALVRSTRASRLVLGARKCTRRTFFVGWCCGKGTVQKSQNKNSHPCRSVSWRKSVAQCGNAAMHTASLLGACCVFSVVLFAWNSTLISAHRKLAQRYAIFEHARVSYIMWLRLPRCFHGVSAVAKRRCSGQDMNLYAVFTMCNTYSTIVCIVVYSLRDVRVYLVVLITTCEFVCLVPWSSAKWMSVAFWPDTNKSRTRRKRRIIIMRSMFSWIITALSVLSSKYIRRHVHLEECIQISCWQNVKYQMKMTTSKVFYNLKIFSMKIGSILVKLISHQQISKN